MTFQEHLQSLGACQGATEWVGEKTWKEAYETCPRGDWLLWLFKKSNPEDLQRLTLAKGHCANTVRHLMRDERSTSAVDAAIAFGEGRLSREELEAYAAAATAAATDAAAATYDAAADAAAYAAAYAAYAADAAAAAAATATYDAAAADAAACAAYAARTANQLQTADICRKYLPIEIWNIPY